MSRREIADRAGCDKSFDLIEKAYEVYPAKMSNLWSLYFVSPASYPSVTKIGIATDPYERLRGLQCGCWDELRIYALFWFTGNSQSAALEYNALRLAKKEGVRLKGEWLDLPWQEAVGLVLCADEQHTLRYTDNHGVIHEWFPELKRQQEEAEEAFYAKPIGRTKAA